jgi:aminoglycoside phosphotransferase (APT) family kinase protein
LAESSNLETLDVVRNDDERFLSEQTGKTARVVDAKLLAGGASQESWSIDVRLDRRGEPTSGATEQRSAGQPDLLMLVMRRDMGGVLTFATLPRATEFAVINAAYAAGVPVPKPFFEAATIGGKPAFFMQRVAGEAVGRRLVNDPAFANARAKLPQQMAEALATIHRIDLRAGGLADVLPGAAVGAGHAGNAGAAVQTATRAEIERLYRELDSVDEAHPALELALRWLARNEPARESERTLVHGDYRIGNVLVGDDGLAAILDWEFAHIGDPIEDVAWPCVKAWRFGNDALEFGGTADRETWLRAYERASGRTVDRERIAYLEVLGNVRWAVGALMQARRHLSGVEPSIELASLGRLCAEMEYEALRLVLERTLQNSIPQAPGSPPTDSPAGGGFATPKSAYPEASSLHDRPTVDEILAAVRGYLSDEVAQTSDRRARFRALIAANVLGIAQRELLTADEDASVEDQGLRALGYVEGEAAARRRRLCGEIRAGDFDTSERFGAALSYAREIVERKLAVSNPRYLKA